MNQDDCVTAVLSIGSRTKSKKRKASEISKPASETTGNNVPTPPQKQKHHKRWSILRNDAVAALNTNVFAAKKTLRVFLEGETNKVYEMVCTAIDEQHGKYRDMVTKSFADTKRRLERQSDDLAPDPRRWSVDKLTRELVDRYGIRLRNVTDGTNAAPSSLIPNQHMQVSGIGLQLVETKYETRLNGVPPCVSHYLNGCASRCVMHAEMLDVDRTMYIDMVLGQRRQHDHGVDQTSSVVDNTDVDNASRTSWSASNSIRTQDASGIVDFDDSSTSDTDDD